MMTAKWSLRRVAAQTAMFSGFTIGCFAPCAAGQQLDRSVRPPAAAPTPFAFPATHTTTLDNGLTVIVVENHALPLVAVRLELNASDGDDPPGEEGLFAMDSVMVGEGSTDMTAAQQADTMGQLGNDVSPYGFTTVTSSFAPSLRLMADMVTRPAFPPEAFDRVKSALMLSAQSRRAIPYYAGRRVMSAKMFGAASPITRASLPTQAGLSAITPEILRAFHDSIFRPNNATLIIVGDVQTADALAAARATFDPWKSGPVRAAVRADALDPAPTTIYLLDRPGLPRQSWVLTGEHAIDHGAPDAYALDVLSPILGSTPSSRLQQNLRERHSYMYSGFPALISWQPSPFPSLLYGWAPVNAAKTDSALIEWLGELRGMRDRPPSADEMANARRYVIGSLIGQIETDDGVADRLVYLRRNGLPLDYYDHYTAAIDQVTPDDVLAAARRYIDPDHLVIVVVADRKTVEPLLRAANIAPVVVVDDDGNPLPPG